MSLLKDITTTKDGESFDVSRVVMTANALALVPVFLAGVGCYIAGWYLAKPFDLQTLFTSVLTYEGGVGALLVSGAASILMKKSTEPNGAVNEETDITRGKQPPVTNVNVTNI